MPSQRYMTSEFEKQAYKFHNQETTSLDALQAINQHGGFRLETMEMCLGRWEQEMISTKPCSICCEYIPSDEMFTSTDKVHNILTQQRRSSNNNNQVNVCKHCLRQYLRVEMTEGKPLWDGVRCFCGCQSVIPDDTIKTLFNSSPDLLNEYSKLDRVLRSRRIASSDHLRFCPNEECQWLQLSKTLYFDLDNCMEKWDHEKNNFPGTLYETEPQLDNHNVLWSLLWSPGTKSDDLSIFLKVHNGAKCEKKHHDHSMLADGWEVDLKQIQFAAVYSGPATTNSSNSSSSGNVTTQQISRAISRSKDKTLDSNICFKSNHIDQGKILRGTHATTAKLDVFLITILLSV